MSLKLLVFLMFVSVAGRAQTIDVLVEGESEKRIHTQARKEIVDKAVQETSMKYISEIIGESKTNRNMALIKNKIVKQSGKYILYIKTDQLKKSAEDPSKKQLNVSLKISLENLRQILLSNGLLYKTEGSPKVLPLITFDDRKSSEKFIWWSSASSSSFLKSISNRFYSQMRSSFEGKFFFSAMPVANGYIELLPQQLKLENPRLEDSLVIGEFFSSDIIVKGKVQLKNVSSFSDQVEISILLTAFQTSNGRLIADVKRTYKTESGSYKLVINRKLDEVMEAVTQDLVSQIYAAWQSGTFGSSLIRLTLNGNVNYLELMALKTKVSQLKEVRRIRERFFARKTVSFEVDASVLPEELAKIIKGVHTARYGLKLDDVDKSEIEFDIVTRR